MAAVVFQPQQRTILNWTLSAVMAAEAQADNGQLRNAAILTERLLKDDRVRGCASQRASLVRLPLTFEESGPRSKQAVDALGLEGDFWRLFPIAELKKLHQWGFMLGLGLGYRRWVDKVTGKPFRHNGRNYFRLETWHPAALEYEVSTDKWTVQVNDGAERREITRDDREFILYTPFGAVRPWAEGNWTAVKLWWSAKQFSIQDWARYNEKHGLGTFVAQGGKNVEERTELTRKLRRLGSEKAVAIPPEWTLSLLESRANTFATFKEQIMMADAGSAIAIVGQNLTSEVSSGSYAAASVHKYVAAQIVGADAEGLSAFCREAMAPYGEANWGDREVVPYPVWDTTPPEDDEKRVGTLKSFGEAITAIDDAGFEVENVEEIGEQLGIKLKRKEEPPKSDPPEDPEEETEDPPEDDASAQAALRGSFVRTFAGARLAADSGFVAGQLYADALTEYGAEAGAEQLKSSLVAVLGALDEAQDYADLANRLREVYADLSPDEFAAKLQATLMLADLGGRLAVHRDTPELE